MNLVIAWYFLLPQDTLAGADSSLIQNEIHETMTQSIEGI